MPIAGESCVVANHAKYIHHQLPSFNARLYWIFIGQLRIRMLIGSARVSTDDQPLDLQRDALANAGCDRLFIEQILADTLVRRIVLARVRDYFRHRKTEEG